MQFFRRYRMELPVANVTLPRPELTTEIRFVRWDPKLIDRHAHVKYESFRGELDSTVFPCLGDLSACRRLMHEISEQDGFVPSATWLIVRKSFSDDLVSPDCGTIQGLAASRALGAIQNVGVIPETRGLGLGRALVLRSLHGFKAAGMRRVYLEVTAANQPAVALYRSLGFRVLRTMYKASAEAPLGAA